MTWSRVLPFALAAVLFAAAAAAQQQPIFDPDDFVDPAQRQHRPLFVSRLVLGAVASSVNHYRPVDRGFGFAHVANSLYWGRFQFDYKHTQVNDDVVHVERCDCPGPIYFPTPPSAGATPNAPPPSPEDTLQVAWYWSLPREGRFPIVSRVRFTWSGQSLDTIVKAPSTGKVIARLHGRDQSIGLDADTQLPIGPWLFSSSLQFARTTSSGTTDRRAQNEFLFTSRFPGWQVQRVFIRTMLGIGNVSNRDGTALNAVNPTVELYYRIGGQARVNVHMVWNPVTTRDGAKGWTTTHQVAFFVDRAYLKLFRLKR